MVIRYGRSASPIADMNPFAAFAYCLAQQTDNHEARQTRRNFTLHFHITYFEAQIGNGIYKSDQLHAPNT